MESFLFLLIGRSALFYGRKRNHFNIRDKPLTRLHALNRVFVNGKPIQLQTVGKLPLGNSQFPARPGNHLTT